MRDKPFSYFLIKELERDRKREKEKDMSEREASRKKAESKIERLIIHLFTHLWEIKSRIQQPGLTKLLDVQQTPGSNKVY